MNKIWIVPILSFIIILAGYYFIFGKKNKDIIEDPYKTKKPVVDVDYEPSEYTEMATDYDFSLSLKDLQLINRGLNPVEELEYINIINLKHLSYETN